MKTIKVYNNRTCDMKELGNQLGVEGQALMIDMSDKYIVYKNDVGFEIMTRKEVISYADQLVSTNPEIWTKKDSPYEAEIIVRQFWGDEEIEEERFEIAKKIIENTLDNETVYQVESQV